MTGIWMINREPLRIGRKGIKVVQETVDMDKNDSVDMMEMGRKALNHGEYKDAYTYFNQVVKKEANNWEAVFYRGLSEAWQTTARKSRLYAVVDGTKEALHILKKSGVSDEEQKEIKKEFVEQIDYLTSEMVDQASDKLYEKENKYVRDIERDGKLRLRLMECLDLYQFELELLDINNEEMPHDMQFVLLKAYIDTSYAVCSPELYAVDRKQVQFVVSGVPLLQKKKYLEKFDEYTGLIRRVEPMWHRNSTNYIDRLEPPKDWSGRQEREKLLLEMQNQVDQELEEKERIRQEKKKEEEQKKYWENHPEEYRGYLEEQNYKKMLEEKREDITKQIAEQRKIAASNKWFFWGEGAKQRKEAQKVIRSLKKELEILNHESND